MKANVLLLGGTAEARLLAQQLADLPGLNATASLAGATKHPADYALPVRSGGFGGIEGLADWLKKNDIDALVDATHPYASQMQANSFAACEITGTPRLQLLREPWAISPKWTSVSTIQAAADALEPGAKVLLTTGRKEISPFVYRSDCQFTLRTIEAAARLPAHISPLHARPPFDLIRELETIRSGGFTHMVTKNAGGSGTAKLEAAEILGLGIIMVGRPPAPPGLICETVPQAVAWLHETVGNRKQPKRGAEGA